MAKTRSPDWFDKIALELGYVSIHWARIERYLDELIMLLAGVSDEKVSFIVAGNIDLRGKVQIGKSLVYLAEQDREWTSFSIRLLDRIDNELRIKRNTYIHSGWYNPGGVLTRAQRKTRISRPQAFKINVDAETFEKVKLVDVRKFNKDLDMAMIAMIISSIFIIHDRENLALENRRQSLRQYLRHKRLSAHRLRIYLGPRRRS